MATAEKLVTQHLDLWTTAIKRKSAAGRGSSSKVELYGIQKLRELILELAVRGLLVPQDPKDEPAIELVKKISAEKTKLIAEGKAKTEKPLSPIAEEEKPFEVPAGWELARLGITGRYINGLAFKPADWGSEGLPIIRIQNLSGRNKEYNYTTRQVEDDVIVNPGEMLVSWSATLDVFVWNGKSRGVLNQHIFRVVPSSLLDPRFLFWLLKHSIQRLAESDHAHGLVMPHINRGDFLGLPIVLPPVAEQHRIVAKVDELMSLCGQLEQQTDASLGTHQSLVATLLNSLTSVADHAQFASSWQRIAEHFNTLFTTEESIDQLKQTILDLMANGVLVKFPDKASKVPLKKILCFGPRNGFSPKESANEKVTKVLKLGATSYGKLDLSQVKSFDEDIPTNSHLWLRKGDILVQRGNSHIFVGSNVLVEEDVTNTIYPDLMMKLRVTGDALPGYVSLILSAPQSRTHMWERMTGTSGTMPKISKGVVESIPLVVPPVEVQEKVISTIRLLFTLCDQIKVCLCEAQITQQHLADALAEQALAEA